MSAQKTPALIRARKRLNEVKKRNKAQDKFGSDTMETFERPDTYIGKKVEETQ